MQNNNSFYNDENFIYNFVNTPIPPNVPPHFHNCYEILFFQKGDAVYMVEGNIYELSQGDILITNPREMHCPIFKSNAEYKRSIISFKPSFLSDFITCEYNPLSALERRKIGTNNKIDTKIVKDYNLCEKIEIIGYYSKTDLPEKNVMIKSHLLQFLVSINNIILTQTNDRSSDKIENIIQYINENLSSRITLDTLSDNFYLNKYHIAHLFKEKIGITVTEYITYKRIMLSKELILNDMPLTQIPQMIGFGDYSSFYRAFVKIVGVKPSKIHK